MFDLVLFWALDRFSREGMVPTINYLQRLSNYGVRFHSYTEAHLATDNEVVSNVPLALMSTLAKVEAQKISERLKAGMAKAREHGTKSGKPIGRLRIAPAIERKVRMMLEEGVGMLRIADKLKVGSGTVQRIAREARPFQQSASAGG